MYEPKPLSEQPGAKYDLWASDVLAGNCTFVVGAGLSMAPPTALESGPALAKKLNASFSSDQKYVDAVKDAGIKEDDLQGIADVIEEYSSDGIELAQRRIVELCDFVGREPNYGHIALSLLLSEGLVHGVSLNWDNFIETAANRFHGSVIACYSLDQMTGVVNHSKLLKPHGTAEIPISMLMSTSQMSAPPWWIGHTAATAMVGTRSVFLGLNEVPPYQESTVKKLAEKAGPSSSLSVVAPVISDQWKDLLGENTSDWFVEGTADEILDCVLRAITLKSVDRAKSGLSSLVGPLNGLVLAVSKNGTVIRPEIRERSACLSSLG